MYPIAHTPCSLDIDDDENIKSHQRLPILSYVSPAQSSRILDTPQSIESVSHSWLPNHSMYSQELSPWGECNHQCDPLIYFNDGHKFALDSNSEHALFAPLIVNDTELMPHAQSEFDDLAANEVSVPDTDYTGLPMAALDFFSDQNTTIEPPHVLDKEYLEILLMSDLPMIMDMSASHCGDICLPFHDQPLSSPQPTTSSLTQSIPHPSVSIRSTSTLFSPPSVISDHADPIRPYACGKCHQKYTRPQDCTRHIKSKHIKTKHFICNQGGCERSYCRSDVFKRHLRNVHHLPSI